MRKDSSQWQNPIYRRSKIAKLSNSRLQNAINAGKIIYGGTVTFNQLVQHCTINRTCSVALSDKSEWPKLFQEKFTEKQVRTILALYFDFIAGKLLEEDVFIKIPIVGFVGLVKKPIPEDKIDCDRLCLNNSFSNSCVVKLCLINGSSFKRQKLHILPSTKYKQRARKIYGASKVQAEGFHVSDGYRVPITDEFNFKYLSRSATSRKWNVKSQTE